MPCCKEKEEVRAAQIAQIEDIRLSAVGFGFDSTWISDLLAKYGSDAVALVVEAVRGGFSKDLVVDVLDKFGPLVLEFLINLLNKHKMAARGVAGELVVGEQVGAIDATIIQTMIEKYLPILVDKYGQQILDLIVSFVISRLTK